MATRACRQPTGSCPCAWTDDQVAVYLAHFVTYDPDLNKRLGRLLALFP